MFQLNSFLTGTLIVSSPAEQVYAYGAFIAFSVPIKFNHRLHEFKRISMGYLKNEDALLDRRNIYLMVVVCLSLSLHKISF